MDFFIIILMTTLNLHSHGKLFEGHIAYVVEDRLGTGRLDLSIGPYLIQEKWSGNFCLNRYGNCPTYYFDVAANFKWNSDEASDVKPHFVQLPSRSLKGDRERKRQICGYLCYPVHIEYPIMEFDFGTTKVKETLWLAESLYFNQFDTAFWHPLFANGYGNITLQIDRRIITITEDNEQYTSIRIIRAHKIKIRSQ